LVDRYLTVPDRRTIRKRRLDLSLKSIHALGRGIVAISVHFWSGGLDLPLKSIDPRFVPIDGRGGRLDLPLEPRGLVVVVLAPGGVLGERIRRIEIIVRIMARSVGGVVVLVVQVRLRLRSGL
jgi:hypothetical protein